MNTKKVNPKIKIIMIIEAPPEDEALYKVNTGQAFIDAGIKVKSLDNIKRIGVSIIFATKSFRKGYSVPIETIKNEEASKQ